MVRKTIASASGAGLAAGVGAANGAAEVFSKPPDDHPIYRLIGRVASEMAYFELTLDAIIAELAEVDQQTSACFTAQMTGHYPRYNAIIALLTKNGLREISKKAEQQRNKAFAASEKRNRIVHDAWYITTSVDGGEPKQHLSMPKKDLRFGISDVGGSAEVQATIVRIQECLAAARELRLEIRAELVASRNKYPNRNPGLQARRSGHRIAL